MARGSRPAVGAGDGRAAAGAGVARDTGSGVARLAGTGTATEGLRRVHQPAAARSTTAAAIIAYSGLRLRFSASIRLVENAPKTPEPVEDLRGGAPAGRGAAATAGVSGGGGGTSLGALPVRRAIGAPLDFRFFSGSTGAGREDSRALASAIACSSACRRWRKMARSALPGAGVYE